jgi:Putative beta-lactamase-inhibitor-like, PepSY-like
MKNVNYVLLGFAIAGLMVSCEKNQDALPTPEESLIEQITNAGELDLLAPADVPIQISNFVEENYDPFQIEMAFRAHGLGYEIMLENGLTTFFDNNGSHLDHDGMHNDWSNAHAVVYDCMMGDHMDIDKLPDMVEQFILRNYPNVSIRIVVLKPSGKLSVELIDETVLMFNPDGELLTECQATTDGDGMGNGMGMGSGDDHHGHEHGFGSSSAGLCDSIDMHGGEHPGNSSSMMGHGDGDGGPCWGGASIPLTDIPASIKNYLDENYPETELLFVMQNYHGYYMLRLEDCVRLVFDENGVLLFDSGN